MTFGLRNFAERNRTKRIIATSVEIALNISVSPTIALLCLTLDFEWNLLFRGLLFSSATILYL